MTEQEDEIQSRKQRNVDLERHREAYACGVQMGPNPWGFCVDFAVKSSTTTRPLGFARKMLWPIANARCERD